MDKNGPDTSNFRCVDCGSDNVSTSANGVGKVYTPQQFADLIGRSVSTLKNWDRLGTLRANRYPSGHRFYTTSQLNAVLQPPSED